MIEFSIVKKSEKSRARYGVLKTLHGEVETPTFVPVATQGVLKTLSPDETKDTKTQIVISNTFHLHVKPGEDIVKDAGGLNKFTKMPVPFMTDSGGFQVFSLGFGSDLQVGKQVKFFPEDATRYIKSNAQPKNIKITDEGVTFRSPTNGDKLFIGPKESIKIQEALGADIIFAFDECTPPLATYDYAKRALERTHAWAKICVDAKKSDQALYGIVQGSRFEDLRYESAKTINSLDFAGFGIGGDLGESKKDIYTILDWVLPLLDESKPRHLLGIGHVEDLNPVVQAGIDTFDCIVPTHYARHGTAFTSEGKLDLYRSQYLKENEPLDKTCECLVCQTYKRNFICHLLKAREITGLRLLTIHNLFYFNSLVERLRQDIKDGKI